MGNAYTDREGLSSRAKTTEGLLGRRRKRKRGSWGLHILLGVGALFCCSPDAHKSPNLVEQDLS